jgi:CRP-like cAMP-binding protein
MNSKTHYNESLSFVAGDLILKEGAFSDKAFLIKSGKVRVFRNEGSKEDDIATLGVGQIFGEMSLIAKNQHMASVEALTDVVLIPISAETLDKKLENTDPLIKTILRALIDRLYNETLTK